MKPKSKVLSIIILFIFFATNNFLISLFLEGWTNLFEKKASGGNLRISALIYNVIFLAVLLLLCHYLIFHLTKAYFKNLIKLELFCLSFKFAIDFIYINLMPSFSEYLAPFYLDNVFDIIYYVFIMIIACFVLEKRVFKRIKISSLIILLIIIAIITMFYLSLCKFTSDTYFAGSLYATTDEKFANLENNIGILIMYVNEFYQCLLFVIIFYFLQQTTEERVAPKKIVAE